MNIFLCIHRFFNVIEIERSYDNIFQTYIIGATVKDELWRELDTLMEGRPSVVLFTKVKAHSLNKLHIDAAAISEEVSEPDPDSLHLIVPTNASSMRSFTPSHTPIRLAGIPLFL